MMKVKFFAQLQAFTGCEGIDVSAVPEMTPGALWAALETRFPGIIRYQHSTRLARNFTYSDADSIFEDEDEIALIPPVSGG